MTKANTVHVLTWTLQGVKNTRSSYRKPRPRTQRNDRDGIFGISDYDNSDLMPGFGPIRSLQIPDVFSTMIIVLKF